MDVSQQCGLQSKPREGLAECFRGSTTALPLVGAMVPFALVLGAQAAQKGLTTFEVSLMTGLNFAGGSEFAAVGLWSSPPHLLLIVAITFLVNCRHILMGATLAPFLSRVSRRRIWAALFLMCDESWAMGLADAQGRASRVGCKSFSLAYYIGCSVPLYLTWIVFTTLGAAAGPVLGNIDSYGLDMAFPAVFLVIMRGMWKGFAAARPWGISLCAAVVAYLLIPGAWYVAAGAVSGVAAAYFFGDNSE